MHLQVGKQRCCNSEPDKVSWNGHYWTCSCSWSMWVPSKCVSELSHFEWILHGSRKSMWVALSVFHSDHIENFSLWIDCKFDCHLSPMGSMCIHDGSSMSIMGGQWIDLEWPAQFHSGLMGHTYNLCFLCSFYELRETMSITFKMCSSCNCQWDCQWLAVWHIGYTF